MKFGGMGPGSETAVRRGLRVRRNVYNPFLVVELRYEADPDKDPETDAGHKWYLAAQQDMGCRRVCRNCDRSFSVYDTKCGDCDTMTEMVLSAAWQREMEISYEAASGAFVFDAFSPSRNVVDPFPIPEHWRRIRSIDHGVRVPTAVIWAAMDPEGNLFVYQEHYEAERTIDYHSLMTHRLSAMHDYKLLGVHKNDWETFTEAKQPTKDFIMSSARVYRTIGDPSMQNRTQKEVKTVRRRYADNGIYIRPANNAVAGLEVMNSAFSDGSLNIFNTCPNTVREVQNLVWKERSDPTLNPVQVPVDRNNHAIDALKYIANEFIPAADTPPAPPDRSIPGRERERIMQKTSPQNWQRQIESEM